MDVARVELERVVGFHTKGRESAAALLDLGPHAPLSEASAPLVDSLAGLTFNSTASYDAPLGAVDGVVGSGDLAFLEDAQLASELTAFPALVADLDREQQLLHTVSLDYSAYLGSMGIDVSHLSVGDSVPWETTRTTAYNLVDDARARLFGR